MTSAKESTTEEMLFIGPVEGSSARFLSDDEARAIFDTQARRRLNMTGDEFLRAWDAGEFDDDPERVMAMAMLIPLVRSE